MKTSPKTKPLDTVRAKLEELAAANQSELALSVAKARDYDAIGHTSAAGLYARLLIADGRPLDAIGHLNAVSDANELGDGDDLVDILLTQAKASLIAKRFSDSQLYTERLLELMERLQAPRSIIQRVHFTLGSLLLSAGELERAQAFFSEAIELRCGNGWATDTSILNLRLAKRLMEMDTSELRRNLEPESDSESIRATLSRQSFKDSDAVLLLSADLAYSRRYADLVVTAAEKVSGRSLHIHLHGIACGDDDLGRRRRAWQGCLSALKSRSNFTFSHRYVAGAYTERERKAAYSLERFRVLPWVLEVADLPIIVCDIDQIPIKNPLEVASRVQGVALKIDEKLRDNALSYVSATAGIYGTSPAAMHFTCALANYTKAALQTDGMLQWHVDQAALAACAAASQDSVVTSLPANFVKSHSELSVDLRPNVRTPYFISATSTLDTTGDGLNRLRQFVRGLDSHDRAQIIELDGR